MEILHELKVGLHPRKLTAGGPQNDGPWKRWRNGFKNGHFWYLMLDFWGVSQYLGRVLYITPKQIRRIKTTKIAKHCPYVPMKFDIYSISVWKKSLAAPYQRENRYESLPIFNYDFFRLLHFINFLCELLNFSSVSFIDMHRFDWSHLMSSPLVTFSPSQKIKV